MILDIVMEFYIGPPNTVYVYISAGPRLARKASSASAKAKLKEWRDCAARATANGAKRAHRYCKEPALAAGPRGPPGWLLQGDAAVQAVREEWSQYWDDAGASIASIQGPASAPRRRAG